MLLFYGYFGVEKRFCLLRNVKIMHINRSIKKRIKNRYSKNFTIICNLYFIFKKNKIINTIMNAIIGVLIIKRIQVHGFIVPVGYFLEI